MLALAPRRGAGRAPRGSALILEQEGDVAVALQVGPPDARQVGAPLAAQRHPQIALADAGVVHRAFVDGSVPDQTHPPLTRKLSHGQRAAPRASAV